MSRLGTMHPATATAFAEELEKLAEPEAFGRMDDQGDYRATQTNDGPPVQDWHRKPPAARRKLKLHKEAGLKEVLQAGKKGLQAVRTTAQKGAVKLQTHPVGSRVLHHILDPLNTPDLAQAAQTVSRLF